MKRARRCLWCWPILLAVLTLGGLLSALLGQGGVWWWLSWLALATPLAAITGAVVLGKPGSAPPKQH